MLGFGATHTHMLIRLQMIIIRDESRYKYGTLSTYFFAFFIRCVFFCICMHFRYLVLNIDNGQHT